MLADGCASPTRRSRRVVRLALLIPMAALLAAAWLNLAPTAVGGSTSYVMTSGVSMLPHFRAGGLVITQERDSYHVGEVVAYHNRQLHGVVMHRIVAMDGDRYVFKGDNNDFRDSYHPKKSDLVGQEWLYWPQGGAYFHMLQTPFLFALIMAFAGVMAFRPDRSKRGRRRRHHATA